MFFRRMLAGCPSCWRLHASLGRMFSQCDSVLWQSFCVPHDQMEASGLTGPTRLCAFSTCQFYHDRTFSFPEAGARGGSPLSEASILLLSLPSLGEGRLSARFFPQPKGRRLLRSLGEFFIASATGGARDVADAAQTCPPQFQ